MIDEKLATETYVRKYLTPFVSYSYTWQNSVGRTGWMPFGGIDGGPFDMNIQFERSTKTTSYLNFALKTNSQETIIFNNIYLVNNYNGGVSAVSYGTNLEIPNVDSSGIFLTPSNHLGYGGYSVRSILTLWQSLPYRNDRM
jgi:hypothetical protein